MKTKQKGILLVGCIIAAGVMTGCNQEKVNVIIKDGYTQTQIHVNSGKTVEDALEEAEIVITSKDTVEPALSSVISASGGEIVVSRYALAEVVTEEKTTEVELTGGTVQEALEKAGIKLVRNDYVNHDVEAYLTNGMSISVVHRMEVSLTVDGNTEKFLTETDTVANILAAQKITLGELDRVKPALDSLVADGTDIVIKRVEQKEITEKEAIPFDTLVTYSNRMMVGTSSVTTAGVNGEKEVTYLVTYVDGKEESREIIKETVIKEVVNQVLVQGSKPQGKTVVSKVAIYDCDGSGHGYYEITYSDGTVEYQNF